MGEFADYYNEEQCKSLEDLYDYQSGNMSQEEAFEQGIINETGCLPHNAPNLFGVHDVESLTNELDRLELLFLRSSRNIRRNE